MTQKQEWLYDMPLFGAVPVRRTRSFASENPWKEPQDVSVVSTFYTVIATVEICLAKLIFLAGMFTLYHVILQE